jgi:PAS domain S-box-containing protein
VLTVKDTGVGIPAEELPRMFERFHRVPNVVGRTHEGTGIGLSLVNELVKLHGGTITVDSAPDKGSTFTVIIPTGKSHLPATQVGDSTKKNLSSVYSGAFIKEAESLLESNSINQGDDKFELDDILYSSQPNGEGTTKEADILIVDDNADMRTYLQHLLQVHFNVRTAENGKVALEKVAKQRPDLILSDIMMPVMDGKQMIRELKLTPQMARIPVILLSARAGEEARIDGLEAGADDYMVKPFSAKELLSKIKSQIAIARTRYQTEEKLRNLFIQAPVAIIIFQGPDYIVELANDKYLEIVQRGQELIGRPFFESLPELVDQGIKTLFDEVYTTGVPAFGNERRFDLLREDTLQPLYFNFVWQPIREQDSVTGIIAAVTDVTQQVLARRVIEESEQRLEMALSSSQMGVWDLDLVNKKLIRSPRYIEITGHEEEYRPGYGLSQHVYHADKAFVEQAYHEAFMTGKLNMQFRLVRADGAIRWLDSRGRVYFNDKNEPIRMLGTMADITERKEQERQKDEFMGIVSHELKTPVTSLKAFGQVLQGRFMKDGDEKSASMLGKMDTQINKLSALIQDLLDDTKLQNGKLQFNEEAFNMDELLDEIVEEVQRTTSKHQIIKENTTNLHVYGDRERVGQVITNLLGNAIKYSPAADKIVIKTALRDDEIVCSVQDFGIGIPPEMKDKVFDRFFRAYGEKFGTFPGLGLGLHISSEIVKRMAGEIWVESHEGQGSTFHFSLPLYQNR